MENVIVTIFVQISSLSSSSSSSLFGQGLYNILLTTSTQSYFSFEPFAAGQAYIQLITTAIDVAAAVVILVSAVMSLRFIISNRSPTDIFEMMLRVPKENKISNSDAAKKENLVSRNNTKEKRRRVRPPSKMDGGSRSTTSPSLPLVSGLLFALELESASAILKASLFGSLAIREGSNFASAGLLSTTGNSSLLNNFLFFVGILSLRIAINYSLQKYGRKR